MPERLLSLLLHYLPNEKLSFSNPFLGNVSATGIVAIILAFALAWVLKTLAKCIAKGRFVTIRAVFKTAFFYVQLILKKKP
jgi:hypothetical protein